MNKKGTGIFSVTAGFNPFMVGARCANLGLYNHNPVGVGLEVGLDFV
jgi:hypothetical protein